ncbi:MAG TPA: hypothetical protein VGG23_09295 [Acidimicrobiales bacterium]
MTTTPEGPEPAPTPPEATPSARRVAEPAGADPAGADPAGADPAGAGPEPAGAGPEPTPADLAALANDLAALVEATPGCRLWVAPPFDKLPSRPGRLPAGVAVEPTGLHLHLAVDTVEVDARMGQLGAAITPIQAGGVCNDVQVHLHVDRIDGNPYGTDAL